MFKTFLQSIFGKPKPKKDSLDKNRHPKVPPGAKVEKPLDQDQPHDGDSPFSFRLD